MMRGGRAFDTALVTVWTSAELAARGRERFTRIDCRTARAEDMKDAAGVSVKLEPRDPLLPALRADAHYFQIGGGRVSWWFAGTADISIGPAASPEIFQESVQPFLETWENLRKRHRKSSGYAKRAFLSECLSVGEEGKGKGGGLDQLTAYNFMTEMVDALLPAYLPLLGSIGQRERVSKRLDRTLSMGFPVAGDLYGEEETDCFFIEGGAACESVTVRSSPLGSWRFSLAPSIFTSAGKTYSTMRDVYRCTNGPLSFM